MSAKAELISAGIRLAGAALLSWITVRYMIKYLDPNYQSREENKRKVAQLFAALGIDKEVELNEHELRIATQFIAAEESGAGWEDIGGLEP